MSIFSRNKSIEQLSDVSLVISSLGGDRQAFCHIVSRYQNLLCSLAYSSVGDIKHSEDIAQESFIEAWKKLDTLKDPEKLKSWLCGILRFKVSHYRRKEAKQPIKGAGELDDGNDTQTQVDHMEDSVIQDQEQALLWQTLDKMDRTYREPLILFYREQQSVELVAKELDLSLDTAKQRLSRGRKLLKVAMITFVEDTLTKSKPGIGFTTSVLTALHAIAPPTAAAAIGTSATKVGSMFKLGTFLIYLAAFSGIISSFFGLRASLDQSRTEQERRLTIKVVSIFMILAAGYVLGMFGLKSLALSATDNIKLYAFGSQLIVMAFVVGYIYFVYRMFTQTRKLRAQERIFNSQAFTRPVDQKGAKQREYISKFCLLGAPLFHCQFGMSENGDKAAFGWIAVGSRAHGLLFAWGGVAIAPISVGIVSLGIISIGAVGVGIIGIGTVGIGVIGFGASAVAYKAYGSLSALGWESAWSNGFSMAQDAALAPIAYATAVNDEQAATISNLTLLGESYQWVLGFISLVVIIPSIIHAYNVRLRMR